jgi:hypothetical protein
MLPIGFVVPAVLLLLVGLYAAVRDVRGAAARRASAGPGPLLTAVGEALMIVAAIAVFLQGRPAGLMLAPVGGYLLFFGGAALLFVGMTLESLRAARR